MGNMQETVFKSVENLDAVYEAIDDSLSIKKIEELLDRTDLSADAKAIVLDVSRFTVKVGKKIVALGRKIVSFALELIKTFPNTVFGVALALVLGALSGGIFAGVPLIGAAIAGFLKTVLLIFGLGAGGFADLASGGITLKINSLVESLSPLQFLEE